MAQIRIMRHDRTICHLEDTASNREILRLCLFVEASDGTFLPACSLAQYETGNRPERTED